MIVTVLVRDPTRGRGRGAMPRGGTFGEKKE